MATKTKTVTPFEGIKFIERSRRSKKVATKSDDRRPRSKRIAFTFDERSLAALNEIMKRGQYSSMADTIREALRVVRALQSQAGHGFKEIVVRNPGTGKERVLVIPHLDPASED